MKKKIFLASLLFILIFAASIKISNAACRPKNDWTGLCDSGSECSSGICCDAASECSTANPNDYNYPTHDTTGTGKGTGPQYNNPNPASQPSADVHGNCGDKAIDTAIGCIPVLNNDSGTSLMAFILRWAIGVGGGIAFLLIVYAGFMIMTAAGNPERLKAGQELLTSAISGIILLIFSVFILNVIGVKILQIPGFG